MQTDSSLFQIMKKVLEALRKTRELLSVQSHAKSIMFQILHHSPYQRCDWQPTSFSPSIWCTYFDLLIIQLRFQESIDKVKKFTVFNPIKHKHVYAFEKFVSGLGIPGFWFYVGQTSKELKCRSLTGPEKLKSFQNINIYSLLPLVNSASYSGCMGLPYLIDTHQQNLAPTVLLFVHTSW